jgi:hypothetical protein
VNHATVKGVFDRDIHRGIELIQAQDFESCSDTHRGGSAEKREKISYFNCVPQLIDENIFRRIGTAPWMLRASKDLSQ